MKNFVWTKKHRISKSREFRLLKEESKKIKGNFFDVWFFPQRRDFPPVKLAVVTRKKTGNAVKRNRIRRIVREFFRLNQYSLAGGDYVVIVKKIPEKISFHIVSEELKGVLGKIY